MVMDNQLDTIYALSTPVGGALSIIRISGNKTEALIRSIFKGSISHRRCSYGILHDNHSTIDYCTMTFFKAPHSYTGEDMAELSLHGSYAVANSVFRLLDKHSLRQANAGEFTRRAFMNGKMDLTQADAVMDLISATTDMACKAAMYQLEGGLRERIDALYSTIMDVLAYINATIDFPDEMEDYSVGIGSIRQSVELVINSLDKLIDNGNNYRVLREGVHIAIIGKPNVGKSSLLNRLVEYERAIVTEFAGTTRDTIEEVSSVCQIPVVFIDTAGIHTTNDTVESLGVKRSLKVAERANLVLVLFDGSAPLCDEDFEVIKHIEQRSAIIVITKADLEQMVTQTAIKALFGAIPIVSISSLTGEGVDLLRETIAKTLIPYTSESAVVTNSRHIEQMILAKTALEEALNTDEADCISTDLRDALLHLGRITGKTADEEMLDTIFSRFCVGK